MIDAYLEGVAERSEGLCLTPPLAPHDPYACLTPTDQAALCRRFGIPTPTPDVPFASCVERVFPPLTSEDATSRLPCTIMYEALATTTDVRLMIAAHALRCGVRRLPDDPQLRPKPAPKLNHAPPRLKRGVDAAADAEARAALPAAAKKPRTRVPPDHVLTRLAPNPRKRGTETWERYERYALGCTVVELEARGVRRGDIIWDLDRNYVEFSSPEQKADV